VAQPSVAAVQTPAVEGAVAAPQVRVAVSQTPKVSVAQAAPRARLAAAAGPKAPAFPRQAPSAAANLTVREADDGFHPMKWLCFGLGALVALILAANYLMVDRPLNSNFGQTPYANVLVYAHYGAFMQPNVMVIHIPASDKITPETITDFLVALAHSTPRNPITGDYFERVALTSRWTAQYSFAGSAWKQLGDMQQDSANDRRDRILEDGSDASGEPLLGASTLNEAAQEARRQSAWNNFVANFVKGGS
jgi:hypothetical protein